MRVQSCYTYGFSRLTKWRFISYLIYFPEMITGPHREISSWVIPKLKITEIFQLDFVLKLLIYIDSILLSGFVFSKIQPLFQNSNLEILFVCITLFIQFWAASGLVNLIGIVFNQTSVANFDKPFFATSISDFWNRWHISLGRFSRKYIAQPISFLLSKKGLSNTLSYCISIYFSFLFIALWHKVSVSYLLFGFYFASVVLLEKTLFKDFISKLEISKRGRIVLVIYSQLTHLVGLNFVIDEVKNILVYPK